MDVLWILRRRGKPVVLATAAGTLLALAASFFLPNTYRVTTLVEIGQINGAAEAGFVEPPAQVKIKTQDIYSVATFSKFEIPEKRWPKITFDLPSNVRLLKMSLVSARPELAVKMLSDIEGQILADHERLLKSVRDGLQNKIKTQELVVSSLQKDKASAQSKITLIRREQTTIRDQLATSASRIHDLLKEKSHVNSQEKNQNPMAALFFTNEIQSNQRYYNELERTLNVGLPRDEIAVTDLIMNYDKQIGEAKLRIENYLQELNNLRATRVVKPPSYLKYPEGPKISLIVLIAGFIVFMVSVFAVGFLDTIREERGLEVTRSQAYPGATISSKRPDRVVLPE